jgi:hypothetical protein
MRLLGGGWPKRGDPANARKAAARAMTLTDLCTLYLAKEQATRSQRRYARIKGASRTTSCRCSGACASSSSAAQT